MSSQAFRRCIGRLVTRRSSPFLYNSIRTYASVAPHADNSIGAVLSSASTTNPLKDAIKFMGSPSDKATIWTYRELNTHVNALAAGLEELGYKDGDKIVTLLPPQSQEFAVTVLATSKLGVSLVACPLPSDPANISISDIKDALQQHKPKALFIGKEYQITGTDQDDEGIIAAMDPIVNSLSSRIPLNDAQGLDGFIPLTGNPLQSSEYPYLKHIVHTNDRNFRGTITFKSLLVYSGASPSTSTNSSPVLIEADSGSASTEAEILTLAQDLSTKLGLTSDHGQKQGKIIIKPAISQKFVAAMVSAMMNETLLVSPGPQNVETVSSSENGVVFTA